MSALAPSAVDRMVRPVPTTSSSLSVELLVTGAIVDSWVEPAGHCDWNSKLVLQIAPRGRSRELVIAEAEAVLVPDLGWLADLAENLCHGSPVSIRLRRGRDGALKVTHLDLTR
ncbi:hypothetical protein [Tautonia marina]|uniref:hypothetical protein n=1 Tax=Tautonia marina TaxID=2653855 RepID=UPI00191C4DAC|nr:hypothetical protein [Tautonia marina]